MSPTITFFQHVDSISVFSGVYHPQLPTHMVNTRSGLRRETPLKNFNPTSTDNDQHQQLQARITKIERRHEEELRKLKDNHNELEAHIRRPQEHEHSVHMINEHT